MKLQINPKEVQERRNTYSEIIIIKRSNLKKSTLIALMH